MKQTNVCLFTFSTEYYPNMNQVILGKTSVSCAVLSKDSQRMGDGGPQEY